MRRWLLLASIFFLPAIGTWAPDTGSVIVGPSPFLHQGGGISGVSGAPTLVAHAQIAGAANGGVSSAIDTTGAKLIVIGVSKKQGTTDTLSDNKSNTWILITSSSSPTNSEIDLYYCSPCIVGTGHTFSDTGTGIVATTQITAWRGTNATPLDVSNVGSSVSANTCPAGNITPSQSNSIIIAVLSDNNGGAISIDTGFVITDQTPFAGAVNYGGAMATLTQTASVPVSATWTSVGSANMQAAIAVFRP